MVGLSQLRFAAGVCVLAAGLLMGGAGGAVAVADPGSNGSSGSAAHGNGGNASGQHGNGGNASGQHGNSGNAAGQHGNSGNASGQHGNGGNASGQHGNGGNASGQQGNDGNASGQQPSTAANSPSNEPGGTDTTDETNDSGIVAAAPAAVAPAPAAVAPAPAAVAPVSDVIALLQDMLTPVAGADVQLTQLQSDLYSFLVGIAGVVPVPNLIAAVSAVVALLQDMLTPVAGAVVPLTQLQSALSSFLLGIVGVGGVSGAGRSAPAGASGASRLPLVLPFAGVSGVPVAGNATKVAPLDVIALGRASALSGRAPQAPNGAFPVGAESFFPHVFDEPLLIASLSALAAVALPGIGGLVILTVVGVRIQYGRLTPDSHREHRALRDSPIPRAAKRWMSAR